MTISVNPLTRRYPTPLKETIGDETYENDISLI